jgi:hypothetical protein
MERMLYFISPPQDLPLVGNIKVPVKQYHHIYQPSDKCVMQPPMQSG